MPAVSIGLLGIVAGNYEKQDGFQMTDKIFAGIWPEYSDINFIRRGGGTVRAKVIEKCGTKLSHTWSRL